MAIVPDVKGTQFERSWAEGISGAKIPRRESNLRERELTGSTRFIRDTLNVSDIVKAERIGEWTDPNVNVYNRLQNFDGSLNHISSVKKDTFPSPHESAVYPPFGTGMEPATKQTSSLFLRKQSMPAGHRTRIFPEGRHNDFSTLNNQDIEGSTLETQWRRQYRKPRNYDHMDYSDVSGKVVLNSKRYKSTNRGVDLSPE